MARRKVQSNRFLGDPNDIQDEVMRDLSTMSTLLEGQEFQRDLDLSGTAQEFQPTPEFQFPQVPKNPAEFEDKMGVDDVPGIPEGIELLGDLAGLESKEDALESVEDQVPISSLPETSDGGLQDPLEFIRMRIQEDPSLAQHLPEETLKALEASQPQPQPQSEKDFLPPQESFDESTADFSSKDGFIPPPQEDFSLPQEDPGSTGMLSSIGGALKDWASLDKAKELQEENRVTKEKYFPESEAEAEVESEAPVVEEESEESTLPPAIESLPDEGTGVEVSAEDIPSEGLGAMPGVAESVENSPLLKQNVENILGQKFPKKAWEQVKYTQDVLTKTLDSLNETDKKYREKLERGDLSSFEKFSLGVAIALPVIMGMVYGKEALLATAGGVSKGFGEALQKREGLDLKILDKIAAVQKEKKDVAEKHSKIQENFIKTLDNPDVYKLYNNYDVIDVVDTEDGEQEIALGKDAIKVGDSIGISAGDESKSLWYDTNLIRDDEDVKTFKSAVKDAKVAISEQKEVNKNLQDFKDVMGVIKEQNPNAYSVLIAKLQPSDNNWMSFAGGVIPDSLKALKVDIIGSDGVSRPVLALPLLEQKVAAMQDSYRRRYLEQNQLTKHFTEHWQSIFPDPSSIKSWLKSDYETMLQMTENFQTLLNKKTIETLVGSGFLREPIEKLLPNSGGNIRRSTSAYRQDITENPEKYESKVRE